MGDILTFEEAERLVNRNVDPNELLPGVSRDIQKYLKELGVEGYELPSSEVIVRELHGYRLPDGSEAKILGKYNPFNPAKVYVDPDALMDEETAREVLADEQVHVWQHFSGVMDRYLQSLGSDAALAYIEGAAAAVTEDILGNSRAHPAAKELYRMLEQEVGKYDALLGTGRALPVAKELWQKYGSEVARHEPAEEAA